MFTGLVEQTGIITRLGSSHLTVKPEHRFEDPEVGESCAVNGCCLTAERFLPDGSIEFYTLAETLRRTNLGALAGGCVNLERAMRPDGRMGGHIVQGHVDAPAEILSFRNLPDGDWELKVQLPDALAPEIAPKGSVAIDGVSLTVASVGVDFFTVRLIPQTLGVTALTSRKAGELLNIETDVIAKYLRRMVELRSGISPAVTLASLQDSGLL